MPLSLTVIKVGGSLLGDAADLRRAAAAIAGRRRRQEKLLVVVSALGGVTDLLELAAQRALHPTLAGVEPDRALAQLRQRHQTVAASLGDPEAAKARIRPLLDSVEGLLESIGARGELPENVYARLLSSGERLSAPLLAAAIRSAGVDARGVTSEEAGLRAAGPLRESTCDVAASASGVRGLLPDLEARVVVLTGFYGVDRSGGVALFGRGGSDDTAAAVAAIVGAARLELWKDAPGFMSADPRHVEGARVVPELSFGEVAQLGEYGSYVVHRGCLDPLRGGSTEIRICSLGGSNGDGTRVVENRRRRETRVRALIGIRGRAELCFRIPSENRRRLTAGILERLAAAEIRVAAVTTANGSMRFTVAESEVRELRAALRDLVGHRLEPRRFPPLIGAVGDGVAADAAIGSRMLASLPRSKLGGEPRLERSNHAGLSCTVRDEELLPALRALHGRFFS